MAGRKEPPVLRFIRTLAAPGPGATDGQLLARFVRHRDGEAFAALFRRHGPMVWGVCRRVLGDGDTAEDAFQATFLILVRKAGAIGRPEQLANWLYGVACRTAARARALAARRAAREQPGEVDVPAAEEAGAAEWRDLRPLLDEVLAELPDKYRAPVVLCYLEGKTYAEAAQALGWAEGTVSGRLARARALLHSRLSRRGLALSADGLAALLAGESLRATLPESVGGITAAMPFAAGESAVALSRGVLHAMFLNKLKIAAAVLLGVAVAGAGAGAVTHQVRANSAGGLTLDAAPKADAPAPPVKEEQPKEQGRQDPKDNQGPTATSPDGKIQAVGKDRGVSLFDTGSGKELRRFAGHQDRVTALAFSPDGKTLVSGGRDKVVALWDLATGRLLWKSQGNDPVTAVEFSRDNRTVLVKEGANKQRILEAATGKTLKQER
jgi:RNA polymerase sigma factor (sigma-70 family)